MKQKLVDYLVESGLVEQQEIQTCVLRASLEEGNSVVDEIVERLDVDQQRLADTMASFWGLRVWDESSETVDPGVLEFIPAGLARKFGVLPVANDPDEGFKIVVYDVEKARPVIEKIRDKTGAAPSLYLTARRRLEERVEQYYGGDDEKSGDRPSAPGQGIVRKQRRSRPDRTTARPNDESRANTSKSASSPGTGGESKQSSDEAGPTRQVDVSADNPFMDLVDQESEQQSGEPGGEAHEGQARPTKAMQAEGPEFFDEMAGTKESDGRESGTSTDAESDETPVPENGGGDRSEDGDESREVDDQEMDALAGALAEFDAELGDDDSEDEEAAAELAASSSAVNWGEYRDDDQGAFPGLEGESSSPSTPGVETSTPDPSGRGDSGASGVFPVDRGESGSDDFFDFEETDHQQEDLTLAEVVDRQRQIIDKLEREIEYQKGILQTMAELLVESRVLSKKKLKKRLREFKEKQRRQQD